MNEQPFFQEKPETNIFVQLLQKYLPFWPLFALTIPIALSVSYIYLRSQVPIYVANAKVLLKDPNKGSGDSKVLDALNIFSEKKIVDNEILVLKSSSIVQHVVRELDLYASGQLSAAFPGSGGFTKIKVEIGEQSCLSMRRDKQQGCRQRSQKSILDLMKR